MIKFSELYSQIDEFKVISKAQRKKMALLQSVVDQNKKGMLNVSTQNAYL